MKNMCKIAIVLLFGISSGAIVDAKVEKQDSDPTFHFKNYATKTIRVSINEQGSGTFTVKPKGSYTISNIEAPEITDLYICVKEGKNAGCEDVGDELHRFSINRKPAFSKMYLKFSISKKGLPTLEPQAGSLLSKVTGGSYGKTSEGYSMKGNISTKNID